MAMDTEEMYRRGVADAEQGEPHPFYYQHYYQYRRGYDRARRQMGLTGGYEDARRRRRAQWLAAIVAVLAVGAAVYFWRGRTLLTSARTPTAAPTIAVSTAEPTRTPLFPTPTVEPTPEALVLQAGRGATIANTQGAALRGREQPNVNGRVSARFKEGEKVRVLEGPVEADGFTWWRIEGEDGTGWSAEKSKEGVVWLQPLEQ